MSETGTIVVVCGLIALAGGASGYLLRRFAGYGAALIIHIVCLVLFGFLAVAATQSTGWDGLIYVVIAVLGVAPFFVGLLIGTGAAWGRMNRAKQR